MYRFSKPVLFVVVVDVGIVTRKLSLLLQVTTVSRVAGSVSVVVVVGSLFQDGQSKIRNIQIN